MAGLVMADGGVGQTAAQVKAILNSRTVIIKLFKNNITPGPGQVIGDFTETTFSGYSAITRSNYGDPTFAGHVASISPTAAVFTRDGGGTTDDVYGYYVVDGSDGTLLWSERIPGSPVSMSTAGMTYTVTATRTFESKNT